MAITILELDLTKLILKKYKPQVITEIGPCKIKMTLETKEIIEVVDGDPLLQQEMVDAGQDALEKAAKSLAEELKGFDGDAQKVLKKTGLKSDTLAFAYGFDQAYKNAADEAEEMVRAGLQKVWKEYTKTHRDYTKYKMKIGAKVGLAAVGVGAAVAGAVGAAATGAVPALILSCLGAAKAVSTGLQTVALAMKSAGEVYTGLRSDIVDLKDKYDDLSKLSVTGKEVFAKAIEKFTTVSLNSVKKCETDLGAFQSKLAGIKTHAHTASVGLNKLLLNAGKIEDAIKDTGIEKLIKKLQGELAKVEKSIEDSIAKVEDLGSEVKRGKQAAVDIGADLQKLKQKIDGRVYTGAAIVIDVVGLGADLWGGGMKPKDFEEAANIIGNVASGLSAVKDGFEDYFKNEK